MHFGTDRAGFFWASSREGLKRFDGKNIKIYPPNIAGQSLDPNITSSVFQDVQDRRWFTSNSALHCLYPESDSLHSWQLAPSGESYHYAFHLERDSFLWVVANQQIYILNIHQAIIPQKSLHEYDAFWSYALIDEADKVQQLLRPLPNAHGIERIRYGSANNSYKDTLSLSLPNGKKVKLGSFFQVENIHSLWIPSSEGLVHAQLKRPSREWPVYHHDTSQERKEYRTVAQWGEYLMLVVTYNGQLLCFDRITRQFTPYASLFFIDEKFQKLPVIDRLYVDEAEILWISVLGEGIFYTNLRNKKFNYILPEKIKTVENNFSVNAIAEHPNGGLFFSEIKKGLFFNSETEIKSLSIPHLDGERIKHVFTDLEGDVWVVGQKSVILWRKNNAEYELAVKDLQEANGIVQLSPELFLVVDNQQIFQVNKSTLTKKSIADVYLPGEMFFDKKSQIVILAQDDNRHRIFDAAKEMTEREALRNVGIVNGICSSWKGDFIWFASSTGLYQFTPATHTVEKIRDKTQLLNRSFVGVVEDSLGMVWLSSYNGIYRYQPSVDSVNHFTTSDGLVAMQYVENSSLYASDGKIYFGGNKGITVIDPHQFELNPNVPKIQLIDYKVNNESESRTTFANGKAPISLGHLQNSLSFEFAVLEFSDPEENALQYYLLKNQRDTIAIGRDNPVRFNFLTPDDYQLQVFAANSDNIWTTTPKTYSFVIRPPWYNTWWARSLGLLLLVALAYGFYRYRIHQIEVREGFKRREAEFKQQAAEVETAVLRLQMNPHFIFNSMNSISSYIVQNDVRTANDYLHRFSRLMRTILERSEQNLTDITDEVELLTLYLETEAMRLGKQLDFKIVIDPQIDPDEMLLPTMILQPFIENAIWHGISPKKGPGMIQIQFLLREDQLLCEVEDDGVGRNSPNANSDSSHHSKALSITKRRLDLLSVEQATTSHFEIVDLFDVDGQASGTKIQLFLPLFD